MYYRLVIPGILNGVTNRILYLDADIVCNGSIGELAHMNIDDYIIAASLDLAVISNHDEYISGLGLNRKENYFNSGIMLINIDKWNSENVLSDFNEIIFNKKYKFPDQDVLNIILQNKVFLLDGKFNTFSTNYDKYKTAAFIHFAGEGKPWTSIVNKNDLYMKYYALSPWRDESLPMPKKHKECKKYSAKLWREKFYFYSIFWFSKYLIKKLLTGHLSKK